MNKGARLTTHASVVRLNMCLLDFSIFNDQGVTLAANVSEDGGCIEVELEGFCEFGGGVG